MITLNRIAENIAYKLGEQFNTTLQESIKNKVIEYRELFIRRDLERNAIDYNTLLSTICVELEEVDISACPGLPSNIIALRTKQEVPRPLRLKNNGSTNFKYVGFANLQKPFSFSTVTAIQYMDFLPLSSENIYYDYRDNKIYVYNLTQLCKLAIRYIPSDPRDLNDCDNPNIHQDDIEFPLSNDMVGEISRLIEDEYRREPTDGEEINIEKDD